MKNDEAEKEHREYKTKTIRELEIKDQVREIKMIKLVTSNLNALYF